MKLRCFSYTIFLVFGAIKLINATCNSANTTRNSGILESAFGPVIKTKLEDQSEEIKATFKSGLDEQFGRLETSLVEVASKIGDEEDVLKQEINAKFEDQNVKMDD